MVDGYAFAGLIATVMQASGDDSSTLVTFGWHNRGAKHWRGYIEAACAGTNNLHNPLEDRTELAPLMKYPGTSVSSGDLIEEWVCTNAAVCRVEVLELRDIRGTNALHLLNAAGTEVGVLTNALGVYEATNGAGIISRIKGESHTKADPSGNAGGHAVLKVTVVKVELKSLTFTSDHGVLTDYNSAFDGSGGIVYSPGGWVKGGANNPVSHTRYTNVSVNVVVCAQPAGVSLQLAGTCVVPGLSFSNTTFASTGLDQSVPLTSSQTLLRMVDVLNESISWNVTLPGGSSCSIGSSGPHKIYVTCGNPGTGPTKKRINYVCTKALSCGNEDRCADALWDAVATETYFYTGNGQWDNWHLLDGWNIFQGGDCDNQARCMSSVVDMLGIRPAIVACVYASTNAGAGNCLAQDTRICPAHPSQPEVLILNFPSTGLNEYEGCCSAAGSFYAITPKEESRRRLPDVEETRRGRRCHTDMVFQKHFWRPGAVRPTGFSAPDSMNPIHEC